MRKAQDPATHIRAIQQSRQEYLDPAVKLQLNTTLVERISIEQSRYLRALQHTYLPRSVFFLMVGMLFKDLLVLATKLENDGLTIPFYILLAYCYFTLPRYFADKFAQQEGLQSIDIIGQMQSLDLEKYLKKIHAQSLAMTKTENRYFRYQIGSWICTSSFEFSREWYFGNLSNKRVETLSTFKKLLVEFEADRLIATSKFTSRLALLINEMETVINAHPGIIPFFHLASDFLNDLTSDKLIKAFQKPELNKLLSSLLSDLSQYAYGIDFFMLTVFPYGLIHIFNEKMQFFALSLLFFKAKDFVSDRFLIYKMSKQNEMLLELTRAANFSLYHNLHYAEEFRLTLCPLTLSINNKSVTLDPSYYMPDVVRYLKRFAKTVVGANDTLVIIQPNFSQADIKEVRNHLAAIFEARAKIKLYGRHQIMALDAFFPEDTLQVSIDFENDIPQLVCQLFLKDENSLEIKRQILLRRHVPESQLKVELDCLTLHGISLQFIASGTSNIFVNSSVSINQPKKVKKTKVQQQNLPEFGSEVRVDAGIPAAITANWKIDNRPVYFNSGSIEEDTWQTADHVFKVADNHTAQGYRFFILSLALLTAYKEGDLLPEQIALLTFVASGEASIVASENQNGVKLVGRDRDLFCARNLPAIYVAKMRNTVWRLAASRVAVAEESATPLYEFNKFLKGH